MKPIFVIMTKKDCIGRFFIKSIDNANTSTACLSYDNALQFKSRKEAKLYLINKVLEFTEPGIFLRYEVKRMFI